MGHERAVLQSVRVVNLRLRLFEEGVEVMKSLPDVHPGTRLFARVLGPYLVIAALTMALRADDMRYLLAEADGVWPWLTGAFVLPMGLVVVVLHPDWRGAAATTVSLLGWLTAVKGAVLMAFPHAYLTWGIGVVGVAPWWQ